MPAAARPVVRPAQKEDARAIAELFLASSEGVAAYIWSGLADDYPGMGLLDIGEARYARENTAFSYQNCLMADIDGKTVGMAHAYVMESDGTVEDDFDPVLRPYAELEDRGSFYVSGLCVYPDFQGQGIGTVLMDAVEDRARALGCSALSLIVFEENAGGVRLYERLGFDARARRAIVPHPLIEPTGDAILMIKPLA